MLLVFVSNTNLLTNSNNHTVIVKFYLEFIIILIDNDHHNTIVVLCTTKWGGGYCMHELSLHIVVISTIVMRGFLASNVLINYSNWFRVSR